MKLPLTLTIAGSDSGGGAGIQADLKTFSALGVFGMSVITALTAQNTQGVQGIYEIPPSFVASQIDSIFQDMGAHAVKTGMLSNSEVIEVVASKMKEYEVKNLVVDPVIVAKSGDRLLRKEAEETLIKRLLPIALVVTPNLSEAGVLAEMEVISKENMKKAASLIHMRGVLFVVVKGGHLGGEESIDLLYDGADYLEFMAPKIPTSNTHGTGCTFASAIAAFLARGEEVREAVRKAKNYLTLTLEKSKDLRIGRGVGPMNHMALCTCAGKDRGE